MYRVKQFIWACVAPLKSIDYNLLNRYLTKKEKRLFRQLKVSEQQHSIRVCNKALEMNNNSYDIDKGKMAKIALLHDVGKGSCSLNIFEKSIIVVLDKLTKGKIEEVNNKKIDIYYNHPHESVKMLRKINKYDDEFLEAIEKHHTKNHVDNKYLEILIKCDNLS